MAAVHINDDLATFLIGGDRNWSRFQRFCVELMSRADRVEYVSTALSSDRGRDGRTLLISTAQLHAVVCTSVKTTPHDAITKAKSDLKRLAETGKPKFVALCYNCELQERHKDTILALAREILPGTTVRAEGVEFLGPSGARNSDIVEKHYKGDLLALRHSLLADTLKITPPSMGLRLALATQFGDDAAQLRMTALCNLLRLNLVNHHFVGISTLKDRVAAELSLPATLSPSYLTAALRELENTGEIALRDESVRLTPTGEQVAKELIDSARHRLLDGRTTFQSELSERLKTGVAEDDFDDLWVRLQDALSDLFFSEGMAVVRAILDPVPPVPVSSDNGILSKLALTLVSKAYPGIDSIQLGRAVLSVLAENTKTREWLVQVAATFLSICSLGLHPEAQHELLERLKTWSIIIDTHIVLSVLCDAEDDHEGTVRVIEGWQKLGRGTFTTEAVLEEAAYHAHIADTVYRNWEPQLEEMTKDQVTSLIDNAFVRSFYQLSRTAGLGRSRWRAFICNFRGSGKFDGAPLRDCMVSRSIQVLDDTKVDRSAAIRLQMKLSRDQTLPTVRLRGDGSVIRRSEWDARIVVVSRSLAMALQRTDGRTILITRSSAIRRAVEIANAAQQAAGLSVMSVAALGYAMSLTPGLSISLLNIRELLFDKGLLAQAFGQLDREARKLANRDRSRGFDLLAAGQMRGRVNRAISSAFRKVDRANIEPRNDT